MTPINESVVEQAALAWLVSLGYAILYGPEIARAKLRLSATIMGRLCWNGGCGRRSSDSIRRCRPMPWTKPSVN